MKTRSDSLFAKLKPKDRRQVLDWLIVECKELEWVRQQIQSNLGIRCSIMAVSRLLSSHAGEWRMDRAKERAQARLNAAPPDMDALTRQGLAQQEFELAFSELRPKELNAMMRVQIAKDRLAHDKEKLSAALRTKLEAGLEALYQEIKDNPAALKHYEDLKATIKA